MTQGRKDEKSQLTREQREKEKDKGYGPSHGYGPGHGGPSGPGDVPGDETKRKHPPKEADEETRPSERGPWQG